MCLNATALPAPTLFQVLHTNSTLTARPTSTVHGENEYVYVVDEKGQMWRYLYYGEKVRHGPGLGLAPCRAAAWSTF